MIGCSFERSGILQGWISIKFVDARSLSFHLASVILTPHFMLHLHSSLALRLTHTHRVSISV